MKDAHSNLNPETAMALIPSDRLANRAESQFTVFDMAVFNEHETLLTERSTAMNTVEELIKCRERLTLQIEQILRDQRLKGCL